MTARRWIIAHSLLATSALLLALVVRIAAGIFLREHTDYTLIAQRQTDALRVQSQHVVVLNERVNSLIDSVHTQPLLALGPPSPPSGTRLQQSARRARASQTLSPLVQAPSESDWVERRPRLAQRSDSTFRVDLRGITDLAPFGRGLRAQISPQGGFVVTSVDQQGYLSAAGVAVGDRLVALNEHPTGSLDQLLSAYFRSRFADAVLLRFSRGERDYLVRAEVLR